MMRFLNLKVLAVVMLAVVVLMGIIAPLQAQPPDEEKLGDAQLFLFGAEKTEPLSAHWSPDGKKIIAEFNQQDFINAGDSSRIPKLFVFWDAYSGRFINRLSTRKESIASAVISPDGMKILGLVGHSTSQQVGTYSFGDGEKKALMATDFSGELKFWDFQDALKGEHELPYKLDVQIGSDRNFIFAPDSSKIATFGKGLFLWDAISGEKILRLENADFSWPKAWERKALAFSPDGNLLACGGARTQVTQDSSRITGEIRIWDTRTGVLTTTLSGSGGIHSLQFSPDGKTIISASSVNIEYVLTRSNGGQITSRKPAKPTKEHGEASPWEITVWDIETGQAIAAVPESSERKIVFDVSPDGKIIATGSNVTQIERVDATTVRYSEPTGVIQLRDAKDGKAKHVIFAGHAAMNSLEFSPDGKKLLATCNDGTMKIWNTETGKLMATMLAIPGQKTEKNPKPDFDWISFTPQGYFQSSSGARPFINWFLDGQQLGMTTHGAYFDQAEKVQAAFSGH